jgi:beta-glucosidase
VSPLNYLPEQSTEGAEFVRLDDSGHRYLPLLDGFIFAHDGTEGWDVAFYNSAPSASTKPVATYVAASTKFRINDHKPAGELRVEYISVDVRSDDRVVLRTGLNDEFYLVGSGYMTFPHSDMFEFGLCSVGKSRLFVDDVLVVDNGYDKPQTIGDTFYGLGTREETGVSHARLRWGRHSYVQLTQYGVVS